MELGLIADLEEELWGLEDLESDLGSEGGLLVEDSQRDFRLEGAAEEEEGSSMARDHHRGRGHRRRTLNRERVEELRKVERIRNNLIGIGNCTIF